MKRKSTIGIALLSVLFFAASCKKEASSNIDQNRIYSEYEVTYDQSTNRTTVQAMFRLDHSSGNKIELMYPSRVGFNDENLAWRNLGGRYEGTRTGNNLNGRFTYFDQDQVSYSNAGPAVNPIDLPFGMNNINKNGNFFLPWTGSAVQNGETVRVRISGGSQSGSEEFTTSLNGVSYITLDQWRLDRLEAGTAYIQIERERQDNLQESNLAGGRITSKYKGTRILVNITE